VSKKSTVALAAPTGIGKSLIVRAAAAIMGGVTIVVEPLLMVASDQLREYLLTLRIARRKRMGGVHLDSLDADAQAKLWHVLRTLKDTRDMTMVIFTSPESFEKYKEWSKMVRELSEKDLIRLTVLDEVHVYIQDRHYRSTMTRLKQNLFDLVDCSILCMSGTFLPEMRDTLQPLYGMQFTKTIVAPMGRRHLNLYRDIKPNAGEMTKHANSIIKSHLQKVKGIGEKIVVFENSEKKATAYATSLSASLPDGNFALSMTGALGKVFKNYVVEQFCTDGNACKVLVATAAGKCGFNCNSCGKVLTLGLPRNISTYVQQNGRAGRNGILSEEVEFDCRVLMCPASFEFEFLQINDTEVLDGNGKPANKTATRELRRTQIIELMEMIELLFVTRQCIHVTLEERLQGLSETKLPKLGPCGHRCWHCRGTGFLPVSSISNLKDAMEGHLNESPFVTLAKLSSFFMDKRDLIWSSLKEDKVNEKELRRSAMELAMILLAARILVPKIRNDSAGEKFVILSWNKFTEKKGEEGEREVLAYRCDRVWKCIPEKPSRTIM
jgi:superfamily II DNA helicase RecQ